MIAHDTVIDLCMFAGFEHCFNIVDFAMGVYYRQAMFGGVKNLMGGTTRKVALLIIRL